MALWSFTVSTHTPVAVADATNYTDNGYLGLMGGSTTQMLKVVQIMIGGQAASSAPCYMLWSRDSTVQATPTALTTGQSNGPLHVSTAALAAPQVAFTASTTKPQRSATSARLNLSFNAFGGRAQWDAPPQGEWLILGNTQPLGESSLSHYTGGTPGLMGTSIVYEPL